jgi:hypothetical protein
MHCGAAAAIHHGDQIARSGTYNVWAEDPAELVFRQCEAP